MTTLEIEAFFEIMKSGSISAAAKNLYVTQPALSRRLRTLEEELGYELFERKKGLRQIQLTKKGEAFIPIAKKWIAVFKEAKKVNEIDNRKLLNIGSIGSVSSYILPHVFKNFFIQNTQTRICFHNYHSFESYKYIDEGLIDIAFISDDIFYKNVETIPAFQEPMVLITNIKSHYPEKVSPQMLDPLKEIRLPWNPEYDTWHDYWFQSTSEYSVSLDQMNLLEYFLSLDNLWAIVPASVAYRISHLDYVKVYELENAPPQRIIYYLVKSNHHSQVIKDFLNILDKELTLIPQVISYL